MSLDFTDSQARSGVSPPTLRRPALAAVGGILGGLAAMSCCVLPLAFVLMGVSGAWIGNLTSLSPWQPLFIGVALAFIGYGHWSAYRARRACRTDGTCIRPLPDAWSMPGFGSGPHSSRWALRSRTSCQWGEPMMRALATGVLVLALFGWSNVVAAERFVTFRVDNMTCALCHITVQTAFESVPGVKKVTVSRRESTATVTYDDSATNIAELAAASTNAGYPAAAIAQ